MKPFLSIATLILALNCCSSGSGGHTADSREDSGSEQRLEEAVRAADVFFNDSAADVAKIEAVLAKVKEIPDVNGRIVAATQEFIGTPYIGGTLNLPKREQLYLNTTGVDCSTFVETVIALAMASGTDHPDIDTFLGRLQSIRYRDGKIDGYPSRLHYISDWAIDNARRGNFREITPDYPHSEKRVKTIDYMTANRSQYRALADEAVYEAIKRHETPLKNLHFSIIPTAQVENAASSFLKSGDIVAIVTDKPGLDVSHVGVVNIKNGIPYLIHASSKYKKVVNDTVPLKTYLQRRKSPGLRVFRVE